MLHVHHASWYISLPSLHDYDVKMPNFLFYRGINIFFLFVNLDIVLRNSTSGGFAYKIKSVEVIAKKIKGI